MTEQEQEQDYVNEMVRLKTAGLYRMALAQQTAADILAKLSEQMCTLVMMDLQPNIARRLGTAICTMGANDRRYDKDGVARYGENIHDVPEDEFASTPWVWPTIEKEWLKAAPLDIDVVRLEGEQGLGSSTYHTAISLVDSLVTSIRHSIDEHGYTRIALGKFGLSADVEGCHLHLSAYVPWAPLG